MACTIVDLFARPRAWGFREPSEVPVVYRKGELTKARVFQDWPHHVWTPQLPNGFGRLLDEMHGFCRGRDYHTVGPGNRATVDGIWWCFSSADDADTFCEWLRQRALRR
jgi:hypothetical protein